MKKLATLFIILVSFKSTAQLIIDESYFDKEFLEFKAKLIESVSKKDTAKFRTLLADTILESNDGCGYPGCTPDEFMEINFKYSAEYSWRELENILRFGFTRRVDSLPKRIIPHDSIIFTGPSYIFQHDPENELIILGENVRIREKPGIKSKTIGYATYQKYPCDCNILTTTKETYQIVDDIGWVQIKLDNGNVGYVAAEYTSYDFIKELTIAKIEGQWKIISFYQDPGC